MENGDRMLLWCEGGPSLGRAVHLPPPFEIAVDGGMYVLVDDGRPEAWHYQFVSEADLDSSADLLLGARGSASSIAVAPGARIGQYPPMPDVIESDEYESPALFWLYREIKRLDSTLAAIGVSDRSARREACENYFFEIEHGLTAPITASGDQYTPLLVMISPHGQWLRATDMFDLHEYASSIVGEFYDTEG